MRPHEPQENSATLLESCDHRYLHFSDLPDSKNKLASKLHRSSRSSSADNLHYFVKLSHILSQIRRLGAMDENIMLQKDSCPAGKTLTRATPKRTASASAIYADISPTPKAVHIRAARFLKEVM